MTAVYLYILLAWPGMATIEKAGKFPAFLDRVTAIKCPRINA